MARGVEVGGWAWVGVGGGGWAGVGVEEWVGGGWGWGWGVLRGLVGGNGVCACVRTRARRCGGSRRPGSAFAAMWESGMTGACQ